MNENFLIIDGNSLLNRAFFGIKALSTKSGMPTNALFGFAKTLKRLLDRYKPAYTACAFDLRAPTFRHELSPLYKANRTGMPEELRLQLPYAHRIAQYMGFSVVEVSGYEGDDVIGALAKRGDEAGVHSYIATGDRDSLQLLTEDTSVVLIKTGEDILYTPEFFTGEYGICVSQFVDVKALMGDKSDNIPGVAGIGEKTALKLIMENGSLEAIYDDISASGATKSVAAKLEAGREDAFLSRKLAQICREVPGIDSIEPYRTAGFCAGELRALFGELELFLLIGAFGISGADVSAGTASGAAGTESVAAGATPPEGAAADATAISSESAAPEVEQVTSAELIKHAGEIAVISITEENGRVRICLLVSECGAGRHSPDISEAAGEGHPVGKLGHDERGGERILCAEGDAADFAPLFERPVVCHDCKKLFSILSPHGISADVKFDTMLAAYLLSPGESKYPIGKVTGTFAPHLAVSAEEAWLCGRLWPILEKELCDIGSLSLLEDVEIPLARVLADMESEGVLLDVDGLREFSAQLLETEVAIANAIYDRVGFSFNLNSPKQLGEVLFEHLQLPHGRKTQRGYSTNADTLKKLRYIDPIADEILRYREISKLRSTYGDALCAQADVSGRIHTTFNQCGTATGRLSSVDPNLQNIPVRGELGRELRRFFCAPEGRVLVDADYSQIELRLLAALSGDENMIAAFSEGADIHTSTAAQVFHVPLSEVTPQLRSRAKAVNFGIIYGIGDYSLSQDLGISRREAAEYIERYLATYPGVANFLTTTVENARSSGYTETMFGRRRSIPELRSRNKNLVAFGERVARNSPIQGSAADVIKLAMIAVRQRIAESGLDARLILQVHDELIVEATEESADEVAAMLKECMESAVKCAVLLRADVAVGKTWYDAKG